MDKYNDPADIIMYEALMKYVKCRKKIQDGLSIMKK